MLSKSDQEIVTWLQSLEIQAANSDDRTYPDSVIGKLIDAIKDGEHLPKKYPRRMSSLPMAEICGRSAELNRRSYTSIRAGLLGRVYHKWFEGLYGMGDAAKAARAEFDSMLTSLLPEELPEIEELTNATRLRFIPPWGKGQALSMEHAMGINEWGEFVHYEHPDAMARGTVDVAWKQQIKFEGHGLVDAACIMDHKSGNWVELAKYLLQLLGYGFAHAAETGRRFFVVYLHDVRKARVIGLYFDREDQKGSDAWQRVLNAAQNDGEEFVTGPHCRDCFVRFECPARQLPPAMLVDRLAPIAKGEDMNVTEALHALEAAHTLKAQAEAATKAIHAWVRVKGPLIHEGKVFDGIDTKPRRTARVADLEAAGLKQYINTGKPQPRFEWRKQKKGIQ